MRRIERIQLHASILELIDRRRRETGDENLGSGVEAAILSESLRDIERDILAEPGALERLLVPLRQRPRVGF
jgi:hypothetical protein